MNRHTIYPVGNKQKNSLLWGGWESNPQGVSPPEDFKSPASASSATAPFKLILLKNLEWSSDLKGVSQNRWKISTGIADELPGLRPFLFAAHPGTAQG